MITLDIHPERRPEKIRPIKAYAHMRNLLADKEDTEQVFHIIEALNGNALLRDLKRVVKSPEGARVYHDRLDLAAYLDDHDTLAKLPAGSVGRVYMDFMIREGLSAAGLIAETEKARKGLPVYNDDVERYGHWRRDTHDLLHIMTGYGRDALGEACVLAFTFSQHGGLGSKFISHMAGREIRRLAPKGAPVMAAIREAGQNGKRAGFVARQYMPDLLAENLQDARARLNIATPQTYYRALEVFEQNGLEPLAVGA